MERNTAGILKVPNMTSFLVHAYQQFPLFSILPLFVTNDSSRETKTLALNEQSFNTLHSLWSLLQPGRSLHYHPDHTGSFNLDLCVAPLGPRLVTVNTIHHWPNGGQGWWGPGPPAVLWNCCMWSLMCVKFTRPRHNASSFRGATGS